MLNKENRGERSGCWAAGLALLVVATIGVLWFLKTLGEGLTSIPSEAELDAQLAGPEVAVIRTEAISVKEFANVEEARQAGLPGASAEVIVNIPEGDDMEVPVQLRYVRDPMTIKKGDVITVRYAKANVTNAMDAKATLPAR